MAKSKPRSKSPFTGRWRIVSMSAWDEDYIDEEEKASSSSTRREAASSTSDMSTVARIAS